MNLLSRGLEEELKTRLAQCFNAEKALRLAEGYTKSPELCDYYGKCAELYKCLGELLSYSAASEGSKIFVLPENEEFQVQAWIDFESPAQPISDKVIYSKVSEGHAAAITDLKATVNRSEIPENIAMVLFKGIRQIRAVQNWNGSISDLG